MSVSDTGIGIAPEERDAVFEEFRQVGSDDARKGEGTGLGLALAKKFVELHGGRIWVESVKGKGTLQARRPTNMVERAGSEHPAAHHERWANQEREPW